VGEREERDIERGKERKGGEWGREREGDTLSERGRGIH
jgi:hypothetical protein